MMQRQKPQAQVQRQCQRQNNQKQQSKQQIQSADQEQEIIGGISIKEGEQPPIERSLYSSKRAFALHAYIFSPSSYPPFF
jgi:hypothetical protein